MSDLIEVSDFDNDVTEYKLLEKKVAVTFINGVIQLGALLLKQREKWKEQERWMEYLERIGKHVSGANAYIRYYEYSLTTQGMQNLIKAGVDNWFKASLYLACPDDLKEKLAEEIDGDNLTSDEFKNKIATLKDSEIEEIPDTETLQDQDLPSNATEFSELMEQAELSDVHFAAKELVKRLAMAGVPLSNNSIPVAEVFIEMEKAHRGYTKNYSKLSRDEKRYWKDLLHDQIERLTSLIK